MSWDGIYAEDRYYPQFEVGDEVFTTKLVIMDINMKNK